MPKFVHLCGLVLFLGSILTFAVASGVPVPGDLGGLAVARRVIRSGTMILTLPGLGLLVTSGLVMAWRRPRLTEHGWLRVMAIAAGVIVANAILVVVPAVRSATALAEQAAATGRSVVGYTNAYMTESVSGGLNIALALIAMASGVWRFGSKGEPLA